jgi:simple sugar transport system ATP-binding protein
MMELYMTGREIDTSDISLGEAEGDDTPILRVEGLSLSRSFSDVSFELYRNEVLGITGLLGSGRTELALSLFGEIRADSGKIFLEGEEVRVRDKKDAVKHGIGYVPDDRLREGLFLEQSINNNIVVGIIDKLVGRIGFLDRKSKADESNRWIQRLDVRTPSGELPARSLSGGNQQRLVLAKWLASRPRILIMNGPTVGVDVGSKAEIHKLIRDLARQGIGILLISDDIPELLQTCHRILLMRSGRIIEEFKREDTTAEELNTELVAGSDSGNNR